MFLIILGLLIFFAAGALKNLNLPISSRSGTVRSVGIVIVVIGALSSSVKQIDAGEIGVQSLFGKVQDEILTSGLTMVNPLVSINTIDVRTQNYTTRRRVVGKFFATGLAPKEPARRPQHLEKEKKASTLLAAPTTRMFRSSPTTFLQVKKNITNKIILNYHHRSRDLFHAVSCKLEENF
jgi:hypothetical protein